VWLVDYPGGEAHRVTNDLNSYRSISVTADGKSLITVQETGYANLWIVPLSAGEGAGRRITSGRRELIEQIQWSNSGRIVCRVRREGVAELWTFDPEGSGGRRLDVGFPNVLNPCETADGKQIVFTASRAGGAAHVWKIAADGGQATQLTDGPGETLAGIDPGGRWFYYQAVGGDGSYWCQPLEPGAAPRQVLAELDVIVVVLSRSGRMVSYAYFAPQDDRLVVRVASAPVDEQGTIGASSATFDPPEGIVQGAWGVNDQNFTYLLRRDGISNIWVRLKPDAPLKPLTNFTDGLITAFDYSPDFQQLAIARGEVLSDAVMLRDFR
jgi:hypothetical protein